MNELHYCSECGRGYGEKVWASMCEYYERYSDEFRNRMLWDNLHSVDEMHAAIHSLALEPKEYVEVDIPSPVYPARYRIVLPERRVELRLVSGEWIASEEPKTIGALLAGFDAGREY